MVETLNQNRELRHKQKMTVIQDLMHSSTAKPQPDSADLFMQSIAETIKQFPKHKISKVKMQILQVVSAMEEEISSEQTTIIQLVPSETVDNAFHVLTQQQTGTAYQFDTEQQSGIGAEEQIPDNE